MISRTSTLASKKLVIPQLDNNSIALSDMPDSPLLPEPVMMRVFSYERDIEGPLIDGFDKIVL